MLNIKKIEAHETVESVTNGKIKFKGFNGWSRKNQALVFKVKNDLSGVYMPEMPYGAEALATVRAFKAALAAGEFNA